MDSDPQRASSLLASSALVGCRSHVAPQPLLQLKGKPEGRKGRQLTKFFSCLNTHCSSATGFPRVIKSDLETDLTADEKTTHGPGDQFSVINMREKHWFKRQIHLNDTGAVTFPHKRRFIESLCQLLCLSTGLNFIWRMNYLGRIY